MTEHYIMQGDALDLLKEGPSDSVQCCVTSPPYWGLRDYGTATWEGGDPDCSHRVGGQVQDSKAKGAIVAGVRPGVDASRCLDCGATRSDEQIGLEKTPGEYVEKLVGVFREVRRVLRPDGVLWLNLGDSYAAARGGTHQPAESLAGGISGRTQEGGRVNRSRRDGYNPSRNAHAIGLKHKDLVGIPWRVAFALQADGWWLRSDVIWHKPNPMPESVRDRPTKAHEYLFLLTKSERYFYDREAIAEPASYAREAAWDNGRNGHEGGYSHAGQGSSTRKFGADPSTRNARSVWTIPTKPFKEAHFATFPPELARRCILAGSRRGDIVLDPFGGAGTVEVVCREEGRSSILLELNPEYIEIARRRVLTPR
jgi:DNA modification methylase